MSQKDSSPVHKLTEFPPLEDEDKNDAAKFSISKLMWWRKNDNKVDSDASSLTSSISDSVPRIDSEADRKNDGKYSPTESRSAGGPAGRDPRSFGATPHTGGPARLSININRATSLYRSDSTLSSRSMPSPEINETGTASPFEARTLPNVLRRISNLIAMGSNNQTDIKKYWMPDSVSKECYDCAEKFTTFRRKHHCRICGQIFCSRCCNQEIPGKIIGYSGDLRVCTYCCKIVLSYLQSADLSTDLTDELRLVQEDLQNRFGGSSTDGLSSIGNAQNQAYGSPAPSDHLLAYRSLTRRRTSLVYQEERFISGRSGSMSNPQDGGTFDPLQSAGEEYKPKFVGDWVSLKSLWDDMCNPVTGIEWTTHRHNMMKNYTHCVVGSELVDWLLAQRKISWRGQGVQIGQMLVDVNLIECVSQVDQIFLDAYALYRPTQFPLPSVQEELSGERSNTTSSRSSTDMGGQEPVWFKEINSSSNPSVGKRIEDSEEELLYEQIPSNNEPSKVRLPSANSLYSLDLNASEAKVTLSKPKEKEGLNNLKDPYSNTDSNGPIKTTPKSNHKRISTGGSGSSTTETMTDEFLQKSYLSQKVRQSNDHFIPSTVSSSSWHTPQQLTSDNEVIAFQRLCNAFIRHENDFVLQMLEKMHLSNHWIDIILPIVHKVTEVVRPDVRYSDDDMDIRQYIHFKKVPGGKREECRIVNGVVCTKNVAHRDMKQKRKGSKILLIGSSIDYQRFENRFLSLEPLVMQEYDYLKNTIARIVSAGPDIVVVEKTASRLAQEFLLEASLTLILNVKASVMERIARLTQGVIESSADSPIGKPQLGLCHNFYLETFTVNLRGGKRGKKTLMFFDGCAMHLGCTVLLRGGSAKELKKVKQVVSFLMFVAYNWRLERSLHIDLFSMAPDQDSYSPAKVPDSTEKNKDTSHVTDIFSSPSAVTPGSIETEDDLFVNAKDEISATSSPLIEQSKELTNTSTPANATEVVFTKVEVCNDMSDPLHSYLASDDLGTETAKQDAPPTVSDNSDCSNTNNGDTMLDLSNSFTSAFERELQEVILSASPFIKYALPYLETKEGKRCKLRKYFPKDIFHSSKTYDEAYIIKEENMCLPITPNIQWKPPHPFTTQNLTSALNSDSVQSLLADFRRKGNRLDFNSHTILASSELTNEEEDSGRDICTTTTILGEEAKEYKDSSLVRSGVDVPNALDPFRHQRMAVLFCSFSRISTNMPNFCVNPWVVNMDFYGRNDISLGMFLERYCFRKTYLCPARQCDTAMLHHLRRFVHEQGCITIALKELDKPIANAGENILMWNGCALCKTVCPIVPMSVDAWSLSFAKYLELRFHGKLYTRRPIDDEVQKVCSHSLHNDFVHYFAQENILASFSYSSIKIWEISLPLLYILLKKEPKSVASLIEDIKVVAITGHGVYSNILEALCSLRETCSGLRVEEIIVTLLEHLKAERSVFRSKIEDIQLNLTSSNVETARQKKELDSFLWKVTDSIGFLKSSISETIFSWNTRFGDLFVLRKKEEKQAKMVSQQGNTKADELQDNSQKSINKSENDSSHSSNSNLSQKYCAGVIPTPLTHKSSAESDVVTPTDCVLTSSSESKSRDRASQASGSTLDISISGVLEELSKTPLPLAVAVASKLTNETNIPTFNTSDLNSSTASSKSMDSSIQCERSRSTEATEKLIKQINDNSVGEESPDKDKKPSGGTMKNLISHFMSNTASGQVVQSPWLPIEHYFQPNLTTIPITVFENEPSSIVAFALSSNEYKTKRHEFLKHKISQQSSFGVGLIEDDSISTLLAPKKSKTENNSIEAPSKTNEETGKQDKSKVPCEDGMDDIDLQEKVTSHIEVQFNSGSAKFYCRVYFAEKFRQLRQTCILDGEEFYIRSISRCISWAASGGKSGSTFCKTIDDRFVVKQMNKFEIQSFLDFAPKYFNYMRSCYQDDKPTVLAKIVGVYRIGFKNSVTNTASKLDILIMENLFYERNISQKFDLKGSIRNRLATTSGKLQEDLVLLDENLVNMSCENPLYIRPHTKTILSVALTNDSKFLSEQMVMDYSLLVGLDERTNELVVGIIDYIRTFTWDKRLEAIVKSSGILGGQGKTPTVVSPEEYQTRFCGAMDKYFLVVPDRWMGLGIGLD